ncbi:hypothetical protein LSTR_LSTR008946 [Laodelphax striatellus]|uniref:FAD-binding PCMH-type domain-containing protein n=1 Tax=Laodelphax striatellus TaxID=195883 RepID=A0A482WS31_LAOST|nr:hypothetical protein LSTR_LSTR008946 [Laodelphax striatellus]
MNMYSLMQEKQNLTMKEIENSFGGNICRCTGYRPILDSFKSFAKDAPTSLIDKCIDIEELSSICLRTDENCSENCKSSCNKKSGADLEDERCSVLRLSLDDGSNWFRLTALREIFEVFNMIDDENYMLVGGNTAYGVYRPTSKVMYYIDVKGIRELSFANVYGSMLVMGANLTLSAAMEYFESISSNPNFAYAKQLAKHIDWVANVPVRNTGTIAGNLMIKHQHREFPSDIFLILETIGATLTIVDSYGVETNVGLIEFLHTKMHKKVITKIILPARRSPNYYFKTYKVMPRAQNAHAYVNAGFLFKLHDKDKFRVLERPRIVIGGINPDFFHAVKTEDYLSGKQLLDLAVIQEALSILEKEVKPDHVLPDASPQYRRGVAVSLLYKFILSLFPDALSPKIRSGGEVFERPVSTASQDFDTDESLWPVNKPMPKLEAYIQCSGEAQYTNDMHSIPGELFAAIVIAKKGPAESFTLDAKAALKMPGVYGFYSAKDIPGHNDFMSPRPAPDAGFTGEEIFASKRILFNGQALGVILAESQPIALQAAEMVNVQYLGVKKPVLQLTDIVDKQMTDRIVEIMRVDATDKKDNVKHHISGRYMVEEQYHYTMETQTCVCVPSDEGLNVYSSTQNATSTLWTVADALNIKEHMINVVVKRIGGGYGAKLTRSPQFAAICALGAHISQRAVRLVLTIETNMRAVGKRNSAIIDYQIIRCDILEDAGRSLNPQVDVGQVEGAYVMGLGYYLTEQIVFDPDSGKLLTDRTWTYKPPGAKDIPIDFRVTLLKNAGNPGGVFRSKATGEPALNLSVNVTFAIRRALESARKDAGLTQQWFTLKNPLTCERVWLEGSTSIKDMII